MQTVELTHWDVAVASLLVVATGVVALALRLGITRRLVIAAVRTVLQLALVGLVLEWVFRVERWWWVLALVASMVVNAGIAAVRRTEQRFAGIYLVGLLTVTLSTVVTTAVIIGLVVDVPRWYEPRYLIPLVGMMLGNTLTGLSLCLGHVMGGLRDRRAEIEAWLALGATVWEASRGVVRDAVRTGLVPILNAMAVVGVVSLPGMMTGQILAGQSPIEAVKYQIVVMFMIAGATSLGTLIGALLAWRRLVTSSHQLAIHRLEKPR